MKCYFCGKDGLDKATRIWQNTFRIACDECYAKEMTKLGYMSRNHYWYKSEQEVTMKYKAQSYTDAKGRTLWGVTELDGQVWAIEPRWSEARAEGFAQVLNDNPALEPYDLEVTE